MTILASPSRQTGLMGSALWASSSAPGMWYMRQKAQAAEDFLRLRVNALLGVVRMEKLDSCLSSVWVDIQYCCITVFKITSQTIQAAPPSILPGVQCNKAF